MMHDTLFFRLLDEDDKGAALETSVGMLPGGNRDDRLFSANPASFSQIPGSPFAYWVSEHIRGLFAQLPAFESAGRTVKQGLATADDFRFVRASWEARADGVGNGHDLSSVRLWFPLAKGGVFSRFYADLPLVVNWQVRGAEIRDFKRAYIRNESFYFRPGLTWPLRTNGLSFRTLPAGCVFSHKGPAAFTETDDAQDLLALAATVNSKAFDHLLSVQLARTQLAQSFEVGLVQQTPVPNLTDDDIEMLAVLAQRAWSLKYDLDTINETSHAFILPALLRMGKGILVARAHLWTEHVAKTENQLTATQHQIDDLAFGLYGISDEDREAIEHSFGGVVQEAQSGDDTNEDEDTEGREAAAVDQASLVAGLASWMVGAALGRWDIRFATGDALAPELPDPFDPLPVCSAGMLQNEQGLPLTRDDVDGLQAAGQWDYPLDIPWGGILVDDPGHSWDIEARVRRVLEVVWQDRAEAIEQESCQILGVRTFRDYLSKPTALFADHLKRYSKSRRQAPIYWPLSTASGSYTLWIYCHRLTDQTLFTCVTDFVDPKISEVSRDIERLQKETEKGATAKQRQELEHLQDLHQELQDFREELLGITKLPYKPNLNDGVLITASPLWKLFRHSKWSKDLKACWEKLQKGDYDWAHLAYSIWPDRVKQKCKKDRSLAIAHELEHLCEVEAPKAKKGKKKPGK